VAHNQTGLAGGDCVDADNHLFDLLAQADIDVFGQGLDVGHVYVGDVFREVRRAVHLLHVGFDACVLRLVLHVDELDVQGGDVLVDDLLVVDVFTHVFELGFVFDFLLESTRVEVQPDLALLLPGALDGRKIHAVYLEETQQFVIVVVRILEDVHQECCGGHREGRIGVGCQLEDKLGV